MVHGNGFCQEFDQGHFRMVTLPPVGTLTEAYNKFESFINRHIA